MREINERFVVDTTGKCVEVVLDIEEYKRMLADIEELEAIRAYDAAKASGDDAVPFDDAVAEIERARR